MIDDLDKMMRDALRKRSAPSGFADRVLARVPERGANREPDPPDLRARFTPRGAWWISGALAASLAIAVTLHQFKARALEREGLRARAEVMEALRVTSAKLDLAYQAVQEPSKAPASGGSS